MNHLKIIGGFALLFGLVLSQLAHAYYYDNCSASVSLWNSSIPLIVPVTTSGATASVEIDFPVTCEGFTLGYCHFNVPWVSQDYHWNGQYYAWRTLQTGCIDYSKYCTDGTDFDFIQPIVAATGLVSGTHYRIGMSVRAGTCASPGTGFISQYWNVWTQP